MARHRGHRRRLSRLAGIVWYRFYLQSLRFNRIAQAVVQRLREQVFATAIRLPARYFDQHRSGSLISRITNDTEAIMNLYVQVIGLLVQKVVLCAASSSPWRCWICG